MEEQPRPMLGSSSSFVRGCNIEWMGVKVKDMTRFELVCFIAMLDNRISEIGDGTLRG